MNALAEMTTYLPLEGLSVPYFVNRWVDPSLAFAVGTRTRLARMSQMEESVTNYEQGGIIGIPVLFSLRQR